MPNSVSLQLNRRRRVSTQTHGASAMETCHEKIYSHDFGDRDGRLDRNQMGRWSDNWRKYREQNRNYYRPGRYYAPYRDRKYSRISIGFSLGSAFFGPRFWINDPWQYRLPAAYGSYRWVRYYDDVLLVDVRNGRVVDVIRDFFW